MLAGAVFVEYIFGWNGLGKEIVYALNYLDLPLVMGEKDQPLLVQMIQLGHKIEGQ